MAIDLSASPVSDIWALSCSIFRLRSGEGPFSGYEVMSLGDLMKAIIQALGDMPSSWEDTLFDHDGQPTKTPVKGKPLEKFRTNGRYRIWCTRYGTSPRTALPKPAGFNRSIKSGMTTKLSRIPHASRTWSGSLRPRRLIMYIYMAMMTRQCQRFQRPRRPCSMTSCRRSLYTIHETCKR